MKRNTRISSAEIDLLESFLGIFEDTDNLRSQVKRRFNFLEQGGHIAQHPRSPWISSPVIHLFSGPAALTPTAPVYANFSRASRAPEAHSAVPDTSCKIGQ